MTQNVAGVIYGSSQLFTRARIPDKTSWAAKMNEEPQTAGPSAIKLWKRKPFFVRSRRPNSGNRGIGTKRAAAEPQAPRRAICRRRNSFRVFLILGKEERMRLGARSKNLGRNKRQ